jgi:hypothetical protein
LTDHNIPIDTNSLNKYAFRYYAIYICYKQYNMEMNAFIENCKQYHLTIKDIKEMNIGDTFDVIIWDGNYDEYWIWTNAIDKKLYDPEIFYEQNKHTITYLGNMKWNIHFNFGEIIEHPVHLDTRELKDTYAKWAAIEDDGSIHITSEYLPQGVDMIPDGWKAKHIHWTEFPETTRVGWRGYVMKWNDIKDMPQVYYDKILDI